MNTKPEYPPIGAEDLKLLGIDAENTEFIVLNGRDIPATMQGNDRCIFVKPELSVAVRCIGLNTAYFQKIRMGIAQMTRCTREDVLQLLQQLAGEK